MGGEIVSVLELGVDLAFAFEVDGTTEMWVGRLNQIRMKKGRGSQFGARSAARSAVA